MTANPITDQILANLHDVRRQLHHRWPTPHAFGAIFDEFADAVAAGLPDVDRAVIGQVLLHAGDAFASLVGAGREGVVPVSQMLPVRMLAEAGQRLYAPEDGAR